MPNWVSNNIRVTGSEQDIAELVARAGKEPVTWRAEEAGEEKVPPFNFANFIAPEQEILDSGEYHGTRGFVKGEKVGHTSSNWYEWNIANWGTKWDACDAELNAINAEEVVFNFQTAWSPPEPIFSAMAEEFPNLTFTIHWEEEQGFGARLESEDGNTGNLIVTKEWDIPDSHKDYVDADREESCICGWENDPKEWYEDCPQEVGGEFEIAVTRTVKVTARDADHAKELVEEALAELPPIERRASGESDPFEVTEYDNGVVIEEVESEEI